jgi:hypothetical protein
MTLRTGQDKCIWWRKLLIELSGGVVFEGAFDLSDRLLMMMMSYLIKCQCLTGSLNYYRSLITQAYKMNNGIQWP